MKFATPQRRDSIVSLVTVRQILVALGVAVPDNPKKLLRCPFHSDSTPSFRVFPSGFICFGCGRRGGLLDLVVALEKASDRAGAARWLESIR